MPDIIEFETRKDRHTYAEIAADQARWECIRDQLERIMGTSELYSTSIVSAGLRAMLNILTSGFGMKLDDAKALIARCLNAFRE